MGQGGEDARGDQPRLAAGTGTRTGVRDCELAHYSEHAREEDNGGRPQTNAEEGVLEPRGGLGSS